MPIVLLTQGKDVSPWVHALKEKRPELDLRIHPHGISKDDITYAIAWHHPIGVFKEYPAIKCITSLGAGVDHILKDPDLPQHATVTRIVDEHLTKDMGEFVMALVMSNLRGLSFYKTVEQNQQWQQEPYRTIANTRIGIMGMGVLGTHVASLLQGLGFSVRGWARNAKPDYSIPVSAGKAELSSFLAQSDILVCLLPLTSETENILNKNTFSQLPEGAFIINVARGKHVVDEDLVKFIDSGHLSGASLDVFRVEPLPKDHPFWTHPKINITPHIASITRPDSVVEQILENYDRLQKNEPLLNTVSRQQGY
jgi:glyoxylate/hydroxypyruvate reductase